MSHVKKIYLYLVSVIALVIWVVGAIMLLNMALKTWVFSKADNVNFYSYPTKFDCEQMRASQTKDGSVVMSLPPECSDPNYVAIQEQRQKDERAAQKQRDASQALAMIIVAAPVWYGHWRLARKEV